MVKMIIEILKKYPLFMIISSKKETHIGVCSIEKLRKEGKFIVGVYIKGKISSIMEAEVTDFKPVKDRPNYYTHIGTENVLDKPIRCPRIRGAREYLYMICVIKAVLENKALIKEYNKKYKA